jgi:hypothetical protein
MRTAAARLRSGDARVAVGIEVKIEANVDFPANFGGGEEVLLGGREIVVPLGNSRMR